MVEQIAKVLSVELYYLLETGTNYYNTIHNGSQYANQGSLTIINDKAVIDEIRLQVKNCEDEIKRLKGEG